MSTERELGRVDANKEALERLKGVVSTFPDHVDRDGQGWIKVPLSDLRTLIAEREGLEGEVAVKDGDIANLRRSIELRELDATRAAETQAHTERLWRTEEGLRLAAEAKLSALQEAISWIGQPHDIRWRNYAEADYWANQFRLAAETVQRALLPTVPVEGS